jgi:hypothetical protein
MSYGFRMETVSEVLGRRLEQHHRPSRTKTGSKQAVAASKAYVIKPLTAWLCTLTDCTGSRFVNQTKKRLTHISENFEAADDDSVSVGQNTSSAVPFDVTIFNSPTAGTSFTDPSTPIISTDSHFLVMHSMSTWAAFLRIAEMLNLACEQATGFNICTPADKLPEALVPTVHQQLIPHKPYVDMIPWGSLRDRLLNSQKSINEVEFTLDMPDLKVWGSTPWDPMSWEMSGDFVKKWWFLVDEEMLRTTNFWRGQRGEKPLILECP